MKQNSLRTKLQSGKFIVAPGVFDGLSTRFAVEHDFDALYMTGHGISASSLGIPDIGTATYTEMVRGVSLITGLTDIPLIADADTGFGALLNVERTVRGYEKAGAAAIQIEDQAFPKKCGHTPNRRLVDAEEMTKKLRVAADTRGSKDLLIVARCDACTSHGVDEALRRGEMYLKAGADILFVESPESIEDLHKIGRTFSDQWLLHNVVEGGRTPKVSPRDLEAMGFNIAIHPGTAVLAASAAFRRTYAYVHEHQTSNGIDVPMMPFEEFVQSTGFPQAWEFEAMYRQT